MSTTPGPGALAAQFEEQRPRLRTIAHRTLGSLWDAEDAVQETWLRLQAADSDAIENLPAWLTTVVSRVCIDQLRRRSARPQDAGDELPGTVPESVSESPDAQVLHAEEINAALQIVLDALGPLERLAFVLHDVFGLSFDDIAPIVERTPTSARQLASRARRRIRGVNVEVERKRRGEAVEAFLRASRHGDFGGLLQILDPEVELRTDTEAVAAAASGVDQGAPLLQARLRGADAVARAFGGRAALVRVALVDGLPGAVYADAGEPRAVYLVRVDNGRIMCIDIIASPRRIAELEITIF